MVESSGFCIVGKMRPILKKLDLSSFDWKRVCVSGLNLTDCNAVIDPQIVWDRRLEKGVYPLDFTGMSFDYCSIDGSDFRGSKGVVYDVTRQHYHTDIGRKGGYYPITFIGHPGYNDSRFLGCTVIPSHEFNKELMNDVVGKVLSSIRRVRIKEEKN